MLWCSPRSLGFPELLGGWMHLNVYRPWWPWSNPKNEQLRSDLLRHESVLLTSGIRRTLRAHSVRGIGGSWTNAPKLHRMSTYRQRWMTQQGQWMSNQHTSNTNMIHSREGVPEREDAKGRNLWPLRSVHSIFCWSASSTGLVSTLHPVDQTRRRQKLKTLDSCRENKRQLVALKLLPYHKIHKMHRWKTPTIEFRKATVSALTLQLCSRGAPGRRSLMQFGQQHAWFHLGLCWFVVTLWNNIGISK